MTKEHFRRVEVPILAKIAILAMIGIMAMIMGSRYRLPKLDSKALEAVLDRFHLQNVKRTSLGDDVDVTATTRAGRRVAIQLKHLGTLRHEDLLGRLAHAIVTLRPRMDEGEVGLVVVTAPQFTSGTFDAAQDFMERHGDGLQWVLLGANGDLVVRAPAFGERSDFWPAHRGSKKATPTRKASVAAQPFSELNGWMLKILLLRDVDSKFWSGPRQRVHSAQDLARVGRVSEPHAYRFVRTFEELDFLRRDERGLTVVRQPALLSAWLEAARSTPRKTLPVRWLLGKPRDVAEVFAPPQTKSAVFARHAVDFLEGFFDMTMHETRIALGGFEACRALNALHAQPTVPELHALGDLHALLSDHALEPVAAQDAQFVLVTEKSDAVFRGAVETSTRIESVDILQAALDVIVHPARGREQAEHIIEGVLGWSLQ